MNANPEPEHPDRGCDCSHCTCWLADVEVYDPEYLAVVETERVPCP